MSNNNIKGITIGAATIIVILMLFIVGGYTKAMNDQAYLEIVQQGMSTEGFEEFMQDKQMHNGNAW